MSKPIAEHGFYEPNMHPTAEAMAYDCKSVLSYFLFIPIFPVRPFLRAPQKL